MYFVFLYFSILHLLSISISIGSITSMGHMSSLHWFTDSLGDLILNIATGNLGHGVAVLNLNWDSLHLGVVNTMLSSHFTASVLDSSLDGVSNSMGNWSNMVSSITSKELGISFSISLTLADSMMVTTNNSRSITDGANHILADLLVLNLFCVHNLSVADILCGWNTSLGDKNLQFSLAVGCSNCVVGGSSKELGISLCFRGRSSASKGKEARNSKYLGVEKLVRQFV